MGGGSKKQTHTKVQAPGPHKRLPQSFRPELLQTFAHQLPTATRYLRTGQFLTVLTPYSLCGEALTGGGAGNLPLICTYQGLRNTLSTGALKKRGDLSDL